MFILQNREMRLEVESAVVGNHITMLKSIFKDYFGIMSLQAFGNDGWRLKKILAFVECVFYY